MDINPINLSSISALTTCELYSLSRDDVFQQFAEMPEVLGHMKDVALEQVSSLVSWSDNILSAVTPP